MTDYDVHISGLFTSGSFELFASGDRPGPVMSTGPIPVASTDAELQRILHAMIWGMRETFHSIAPWDDVDVISTDTSSKDVGPKSWKVSFPGQLWVDPRFGSAGLTGMASPAVSVVRSRAVLTPEQIKGLEHG